MKSSLVIILQSPKSRALFRKVSLPFYIALVAYLSYYVVISVFNYYSATGIGTTWVTSGIRDRFHLLSYALNFAPVYLLIAFHTVRRRWVIGEEETERWEWIGMIMAVIAYSFIASELLMFNRFESHYNPAYLVWWIPDVLAP